MQISALEQFSGFGGDANYLSYLARIAQPAYLGNYSKEGRRARRVLLEILKTCRSLWSKQQAYLSLPTTVSSCHLLKKIARQKPSPEYDGIIRAAEIMLKGPEWTKRMGEAAELLESRIVRPHRRDRQRFFWLTTLGPYTEYLTGETQWIWIKRYTGEEQSVGWKFSPYYWWRDLLKRLKKQPLETRVAQSVTARRNAQLFSIWLKRERRNRLALSRGKRTVGGRKSQGRDYEKFLVRWAEKNFPRQG